MSLIDDLKVLLHRANHKKKQFKAIFFNNKTVKSEPPIESIIYAMDLAINQLNKLILPLEDCMWIKNKMTSPSFDHFNFMYKNKIFSVIIEIQDEEGNSYLSKEYAMRQNFAAKKYNLIPCKFPIIAKDPFKIDMSNLKVKNNNGWNLYHTKTNKEIDIQKYANNTKKEMSEWELRNFGINVTIRYLKSKGYKDIKFQDIIGINPQIWFQDEKSQKNWVVVRTKNNHKKEVIKEKEWQQVIRKYYNYNGYYSEIIVNSSNEQLKKLYRGDNLIIKDFHFEQIHSNTPKISKTNDISEENLCDLILRSISSKQIAVNKEVGVFPIPNYDNLELILVPIKYKNNLEGNKNLGIPIYSITTKDSHIAKNAYANPQEALTIFDQSNKISIIKKMSGIEASKYYIEAFHNIAGVYEYDRQFAQLKIIMNIQNDYGQKAVIKALEMCKNGVKHVSKNEIAEGSPEYDFIDSIAYYKNYKKFVNTYIEFLEKISDFPQESFSKAVENILLPEEFTYDFSHPKNTLIDFEKQEINFIDFYFDKNFINHHKKYNMIKKFRDALLGKNFASDLRPYMLIFYPEDWVRFEKYAAIITEKINNAAPEDKKLKTNY